MYGKAELAGDLRFVGLPDLFQILGGNNNTGVLHITSQYAPTRGLIYFINGNPVDASCGPLIGLDAIYALFGWTEGKFEFRQQAVHVQRMVNNSRMEIILDALRMLDDGIIKKVGPPSPGEASAVQSIGRDVLPVIKGPLVNYMYILEEEEFRDGERIVVEGAHGSWIWVILDGVVKITRQTSNGPMTVARLGAGSTIGTIRCLAWREHVRSATATAVGNVQLGVLDSEHLAEEYARLTSQFREVLLSMDARLGKVTNAAVEFFMKENKAHALMGDKKIAINEGLFTIVEGKAYVVRLTPQGCLSLLTLKKDDVFGYAPFMDIGHELCCGSVIASKDLRINRLDTDSLRKEYDRLSPVFKGFIENVSTCVSLTTRLVGKADSCHCDGHES